MVADPASIDPRFMIDQVRLDHIEAVVRDYWPRSLAVDDMAEPSIWPDLRRAPLRFACGAGPWRTGPAPTVRCPGSRGLALREPQRIDT